MKKTKFSSYCINGIANGCKYCVKGEKLVLFISGKCSRNCYYCSLSNKRKDKDIIYANERIIKNSKELIKEAIESNATSAGITGGDPFLFLNRTIKYAKILKNKFKNFHIHIYLPTKLLTKQKLKKLSKYIDEVRFHPEFIASSLSKDNEKSNNADIDKIKLANLFWKKENIGIELPVIPDKKQQILDFIIKISPHIGFVNLNEFEVSETNCKIIAKKYALNEWGYTIKDSIKAGLWLLNELKKQKSKLKIHLCTAELKNNYQFKNRLKLHKILPFGKKIKDGTVIYLTTSTKNKKLLENNEYFCDENKSRLILSQKAAIKLLSNNKKIKRIEEFPTFDRIEVESEEVK